MEQKRRCNRICNRLAYLGVIACTLFIWHNSLMPAAQSAAQSSGVLEALNALMEGLGLSAAMDHGLLRKLAHMSEFALLGALWGAALVTGPGAGKGWRWVHSACGLCLLTAMVDETIQAFVPGRSSQVSDVWIDFGGACLGVLAIFVLSRLLGRRGGGTHGFI